MGGGIKEGRRARKAGFHPPHIQPDVFLPIPHCFSPPPVGFAVFPPLQLLAHSSCCACGRLGGCKSLQDGLWWLPALLQPAALPDCLGTAGVSAGREAPAHPHAPTTAHPCVFLQVPQTQLSIAGCQIVMKHGWGLLVDGLATENVGGQSVRCAWSTEVLG